METSIPGGSPGSGEVHTHIGYGPDQPSDIFEPARSEGTGGTDPLSGTGSISGTDATTGTGATGGATGTLGQARERVSEVAGQAGQKAQQLAEQARERLGDVRGRAQEMASQAKTRAGEMLSQAGNTIEEKTGALSKAQENPFATVGIAFALGFLLAGSGDESQPRGRFGKAKDQVKGAILGGLSAAVAQEMRSLLGEHSGLLSDLLGGQQSGGRFGIGAQG